MLFFLVTLRLRVVQLSLPVYFQTGWDHVPSSIAKKSLQHLGCHWVMLHVNERQWGKWHTSKMDALGTFSVLHWTCKSSLFLTWNMGLSHGAAIVSKSNAIPNDHISILLSKQGQDTNFRVIPKFFHFQCAILDYSNPRIPKIFRFARRMKTWTASVPSGRRPGWWAGVAKLPSCQVDIFGLQEETWTPHQKQ